MSKHVRRTDPHNSSAQKPNLDKTTLRTSSTRKPQLKFNTKEFKQDLSYGGSLRLKEKNRKARPLSSKDPMHLVLKSTKAKGVYSFGHHSNLRRANQIVKDQCAKYGVK